MYRTGGGGVLRLPFHLPGEAVLNVETVPDEPPVPALPTTVPSLETAGTDGSAGSGSGGTDPPPRLAIID